MPAPKVTIGKRVWSTWERRSADETEWELQLLLSSPGDPALVRDALSASILEMQAVYEPGPLFPGEWSWMDVVGGMLVKVTECDVFDRALPAVADGLARRGFSGKFDVWRQPKGVRPPSRAPLLGAGLLVVGHREHRDERWYWWRAERNAYRAVLEAAGRWCRRDRPGAVHALEVSTTGSVAITRAEDVLERMLDAADDRQHATLTTMAGDAFWSVATDASGGVLPVCGGAAVDGDGWRRELARLVELLRETAGDLVYAHVVRGWDVLAALDGWGEPYDWPSRPGRHPRGIGGADRAFEDLFAPDAFGVQLLGPGYADRLTAPGDGWVVEPVGKAARLVQHRDLDAWFAAPFVPVGALVVPERRPVPPLLDAGRAELASVLYTPGALGVLGFEDLRDG